MSTTDHDDDLGLVLPRDERGQRSSIAFARGVLAEALRAIDPTAAAAVERERDFRRGYGRHVLALVRAAAGDAEAALASARAGLAAVRRGVRIIEPAGEHTLDAALSAPARAFAVGKLSGRGDPSPRPLVVPYRGERLTGDALKRRLDDWLARGVIEQSHAQAVRWVLAHPEALDLSDTRIALLGARAEMGPLRQLAGWRAGIVAIDLARAPIWRDLAAIVADGNATLHAPVRREAGDGALEDRLDAAGADLIGDVPGIAAWLAESDRPLVVGAYAYLDGARHVRVAAAMDAIQTHVLAREPRTTLAMLATPTDVHAVPAAAIEAAHAAFAARGTGARLLGLASGGRLFAPNVAEVVTGRDGVRRGLADSIVVQQGPNYALAKRLQLMRAIVARASGARVSIHVAPPATTLSVVRNRLLANAYRAAIRFGVEAFEPATAAALMAALLVHDLRNPAATASPATRVAHPFDALADGAAHGGLWRIGFQPRSVLPIAALLGSLRLA